MGWRPIRRSQRRRQGRLRACARDAPLVVVGQSVSHREPGFARPFAACVFRSSLLPRLFLVLPGPDNDKQTSAARPFLHGLRPGTARSAGQKGLSSSRSACEDPRLTSLRVAGCPAPCPPLGAGADRRCRWTSDFTSPTSPGTEVRPNSLRLSVAWPARLRPAGLPA